MALVGGKKPGKIDLRISHYQRLGIHRGATATEIKEAWRKLSRRMHPDANVTRQTEIEQQLQGALFAGLSESYNVLKDPKSRSAYDKRLDATGDECGKCGGRGFTSKSKGFTAREVTPCNECHATGRLLRSGCLAPESKTGGAK